MSSQTVEPDGSNADDPEGETGIDLRGLAIAFLAALHFLTIVPPIVGRSYSDRVLGRSVGFFPLVGLVIGAGLCLLDGLLTLILPQSVSSVLVLAAWVVLTGGLHLDGFLDSCDALFAGSSPQERRGILRDEHVGAFATAGGVILLLLKYAALESSFDRGVALLIAPVLSRGVMACVLLAFPYARAAGLGRALKDHAGRRECATAVVTMIALLLFVPYGLALAMFAGLAGWLAAWFCDRRLAGLTGDSYGFIVEVTETVALVAFCIGSG